MVIFKQYGIESRMQSHNHSLGMSRVYSCTPKPLFATPWTKRAIVTTISDYILIFTFKKYIYSDWNISHEYQWTTVNTNNGHYCILSFRGLTTASWYIGVPRPLPHRDSDLAYSPKKSPWKVQRTLGSKFENFVVLTNFDQWKYDYQKIIYTGKVSYQEKL